MKCMNRRGIQEYVDSEMSKIEAKKLEGHLAGCPDCKELLEIIQIERGLVRSELDKLNPDRAILGGFEAPEEQVRPIIHSRLYKRIFAASVRIPLPVGIIFVCLFLGLAADVIKYRVDKVPPAVRSSDRGRSTTVFLYSADSVQAFDLKMDLSNYRPIEKSNAFVFKEAIQ